MLLNALSMPSSVLLGVSTGWWVVISVIVLLVGGALGALIYALITKRTLKNISDEKDAKMQEAIDQAKSLRKEAILEAKEEIHKERVDFDKEVKDRRAELQRSEIRIQQKEEALEKKENQLD